MSTHQDRCSAKQEWQFDAKQEWQFDAKQEWQFARRVEVLQLRTSCLGLEKKAARATSKKFLSGDTRKIFV